MQIMARCLFAASLCAAIAFVSCSQPTSMQRVANTEPSSLKNRIHPAEPNKYRSVADPRDWQNPYLIVKADGIEALPISAATVAPTMSPEDAMVYLGKLPSVAWPYGLVVVVQVSGLQAPGNAAQIERNREDLVRLLEKAGVRVEFWPSA
jgi:hypothetical protein